MGLGCGGTGEPDQAAAPVQETLRLRHRGQHGRSRRGPHGYAPDRIVRGSRQRQRTAHGLPDRARGRFPQQVGLAATQSAEQPVEPVGDGGGKILDPDQRDGARGAGQGRNPHCSVGRQPGRGRHTVGRTQRGGQSCDRGFGLQAMQHQGAARFRGRQDLQGHLGDDPQGAVTAGEQLAQIESGHVLQHPSARMDHLAAPGHRAQAHDMVAHRPPGDPPRSRQIGRDDPADGLRCRRSRQHLRQVGRFADEILAVFRQRGLDLRQRRARTRRDDELLGGIERDAGVAAGGQSARRLHRTQHAGLGAVAADLQRLPRRGSFGDGGGKRRLGWVDGDLRHALRLPRRRRARKAGLRALSASA